MAPERPAAAFVIFSEAVSVVHERETLSRSKGLVLAPQLVLRGHVLCCGAPTARSPLSFVNEVIIRGPWSECNTNLAGVWRRTNTR